jgi:glutaredoxin
MRTIALAIMVLLATSTAAQTLFKWVDARGNVSYSDRPPPPDQQHQDLSSTVNTLGAGEAQNNLGYDTDQLLKRSPVVLYTARGCTPCDQARTFLKSKGWPYSEKTVNSAADAAVLDSQFNAQNLPILTVGPTSRIGFSASDWDTTLMAAGYNTNTVAPKGFVTGKAERMSADTSESPAAKPAAPQTNTPTSAATPADDSRNFVRSRRSTATEAAPTPGIQF